MYVSYCLVSLGESHWPFDHYELTVNCCASSCLKSSVLFIVVLFEERFAWLFSITSKDSFLETAFLDSSRCLLLQLSSDWSGQF